MLASQPFLMIPRDSLPRRTNVASAAFAAGACFYVYLLLKFLLQIAPQFVARRVGIVGAMVLVVAHTFWLRAVTPGPEALDALLLAAPLYYLLRFANEGRVPFFYLAMGILGLSLSNNLMMVFLLPVFALWVRVVRPPLVRDIGRVRVRGLGVLLVSSGVALAVAASHWARAGFEIPPEQWAWLTFWRNNMMLSWDEPLKASAIRFGVTLLYSFPPWTLFIGLLGMAELFRRQKHVFGLLFPLFVVDSALAISLKLPDPMNVYIPAWVVISIAVGLRLVEATRRWRMARLRLRPGVESFSYVCLSRRPMGARPPTTKAAGGVFSRLGVRSAVRSFDSSAQSRSPREPRRPSLCAGSAPGASGPRAGWWRFHAMVSCFLPPCATCLRWSWPGPR